MVDEELRAGLAEWVRPVASLPAPDLRVLRRRARRRGARLMATAAAVTAVVAAAVVGITVGVTRSPAPVTPQAAPGTWYPGRWFPALAPPARGAGPAVAPYAITTGSGAIVTDVFSGRATGLVSPPPGLHFVGVAAAGDDRTFVLAASGGASAGFGFYEVRLSGSGQPGRLALVFSLPGGSGGDVPWFAVSPDGRLLAYVTPGRISVISLASGTRRSWAASGGQAIGLSLASDGRLAFEWLPGGVLAQAQVRVLDTTAAGAGVRDLVPGCANAAGLVCVPEGVLISPDGSAVFAGYLFNGRRGLVAQVQKYSAGTGRMLGTVTPAVSSSVSHSASHSASSSDSSSAVCEALWSDPGGVQVTAFCGGPGTFAGGRFRAASWRLPGGSLSGSGPGVAW